MNLALAVGPPRRDGFHDLVSVFQSISLADTLEVRPARRGFSLSVRFENAAARGGWRRSPAARAVPAGRANLVLRAARLVAARTGLEGGARFRLTKRIPAQAGLGGGSADAAAAMIGLLRMNRIRIRPDVIRAWALEIGSDVPFALYGGTALGLGRGERLERLALERPFTALLVVPSWGVSTRDAFAAMDCHKKVLTPWRSKLRSAQILGRKRLRAEAWMRLGNTFEVVLGRRSEDLRSIRERLHEAGASHARMTGSGSAVFGILDPESSVREAVRRFEGHETLFVIRSRVAGLKMSPLP